MLIIDQLSRGRWMWLMTGGAVAVASAFSGCSGGFDSCTADKNCGPFGGAGNSGTAGNAGHGGSSGSAGQSGSSGEGGLVSGAGGMSGMAGEAGAAGAGVEPCDTTKTPTEEACLVSDDYAVFVAPNGKDAGAGTMEAPFATLTNAITMAAGSKFVIVCDATYDEHVVVGGGAVVYGGFSCKGGQWATEAGAPLFKPSDAGPALKIDGVNKGVVIETVNFGVPDAKVPGGTALAALVNASPSVTLRDVSLTAGAGVNGADGALELFSYVPQASLNGNAESAAGVGGAEKDCVCQATLTSVGGGGGPPASSGQNGADGLPALGGGQAGDHTKACSSGGGGGDGDDGAAALASSGVLSLGTASATGWQAASGVDGTTGSPGQGGGGGASRNNQGHGGGGGCGGCGGNGAKGGQGGGASIALLAMSSPVTLDGCTLTSKDAGSGGAGHAGQPGQQTAGGGGNAINTLNSCGGGAGGKGGDGGASGGGSGGVSAGIVWKGAAPPTMTNSTTTTGKAGAKGIGGVPTMNDGLAGVKQDVLQLP